MKAKGSNKLTGKVAIVTGAGQGIGEAIARLFAEEGASVVVNARTDRHVERVVGVIAGAGGKAHGCAVDIGDPGGVNAVVEAAINRFQHIDILVHNAGIFSMKMLEDMDDDSWNDVITVNLTSSYRLIRTCLPYMKVQGRGRILFTSSVTGNRTGVPGFAHYAASKGGINGLIRVAALELAQYRITVNGVEPGLVLTPGSERVTSQEERDAMARYVPLKRWGDPMDVAHAMLYLASDQASYVTGQTIIVDGGALLPENGALME